MLGSDGLPTVVQHEAAGSDPPGMGVATARTATEVRKIASLENIFV